MSSFSIQDLLGLRSNNSCKTEAGKSAAAQEDAVAEDVHDINVDVETVHEEQHEDDVYNAAHQLVTVEVRTIHSSSSVSRSSSRKRKRTEQAKEHDSATPESDGKSSGKL